MTHQEVRDTMRRDHPTDEEATLDATAKASREMAAAIASTEKFFLRPCGARIVIREDEFSYSGKLIIPETAKRRPTTGTVVAIGPDMPDGVVKLGDRIVCAQMSGTLVEFQGRPACRILVAEEILGIIPSDKELVLKAVGM